MFQFLLVDLSATGDLFCILSDRAVPCHIKFLRSQKVVHISCGDEHTAALTKVGIKLNRRMFALMVLGR